MYQLYSRSFKQLLHKTGNSSPKSTYRILVSVFYISIFLSQPLNALPLNKAFTWEALSGLEPQSPEKNTKTEEVTTSKHAIKPGQLIVGFKSEGQYAITQCVQRWIEEGNSFSSATHDMSASLDILTQNYGVYKARSFFKDRAGLPTGQARSKIGTRFAKHAEKFKTKNKLGHVSMHKQLKASDLDKLLNVYLLDLPITADIEKIAKRLEKDPHVEFVQANYELETQFVPNDPFYSSFGTWGQTFEDLWGLTAINAESAWDISRGAGVTVAVVDTGVDLNHPDLSGNIWQNPNEIINGIDDDNNGFIDDINGWNFVSESNDPLDDQGHGTHVAGTIAAQEDNGLGIVGVAPDAQIMPVKILDGVGFGDTFSMAQGVIYAAENGADIINNSWGCRNCPDMPLFEEAAKSAHALGSVVIFAAGNNSQDIDLSSPKNNPFTIVVGASTPDNELAEFSNTGNMDVVAPGSSRNGSELGPGILSLKAENCRICPDERVISDNYLRLNGTSMAAPHVAGIAALILSQNPEYSAEQVRQILRNSASNPNDPIFDEQFGYGLVDAVAALQAQTPPEVLITNKRTNRSWPLEITALVNGSDLSHYTLEFSSDGQNWQMLASDTSPSFGESIALWDNDGLPDGNYTLRLVAETLDGRIYEDRQTIVLDRIHIQAPAQNAIVRSGESIEILGSASRPDFQNYSVNIENMSTRMNVDPSSIQLTDGGLNPISENVLAVWDTSGVPAAHYRIELALQTTSGLIIEERFVIVDPLLHPGWPVDYTPIGPGQGQFGAASLRDHSTFADVNGDGLPELVMAYNKEISLFTEDGSQLPGWPQRIDTDGAISIVVSAPAVGDIDGDGEMEVVTTSDRGLIFAWEADGTNVANFPFRTAEDDCGLLGCATPNHQNFTLHDMDGDNILDIITTDGRGNIYALRGDTSLIPGFPVTIESDAIRLSNPVVADFNNDGNPEIVFTSRTFNNQPGLLHQLDHQGQTLPNFPIELIETISPATPIAADFDNDDDLEILFKAYVSESPRVFAFHHTGEPVDGFPLEPANNSMTNPILGDINGDGEIEIILGSDDSIIVDGQGINTGFIYAWNTQGNLLPNFPITVPGIITFSDFALADVDNDGLADIITQQWQSITTQQIFENFGIRAFRHDGSEIEGMARPMQIIGHSEISPAVGDIDGDGLLELTSLDQEGNIYLWDLDADSSNVQPWPMSRKNALHSGVVTKAVNFRTIPARIEAEDYDSAVETDPTNNGGACDRGDGVDMQTTNDQNGVCNIGWTEVGESLSYQFSVLNEATFSLSLRLASDQSDKDVDIILNGQNIGTLTSPNNGWQNFEDRSLNNINLGAGDHTVQVIFNTGLVNFNFLEFTEQNIEPPPPPPIGSVIVPAKIEAEAYLRFGESDTINNGAADSPQCDRQDGVDAQTADEDGTCNIGWTSAGEFLEYDIFVETESNFIIDLRTATDLTDKTIRLLIDDNEVGTQTVNQAGWQAFGNNRFTTSLAAGEHTMRVEFITGAVNLNYIDIKTTTVNPPPPPVNRIVPARIEAEDYDRFNDSTDEDLGSGCDNGDAVDKQPTTDGEGGNCNIGWTISGEWLEYDFSLEEDATLDFISRVSANETGKSFHLELDGVDVSGTLSVPANGWQNWSNVKAENIFVSAGDHVLRIVFDTGSTNFNFIDVQTSSSSEPPPEGCADSANLVSNCNFDQGLSGYEDSVFLGNSSGTHNVVNDVWDIVIDNPGDDTWDVQPRQDKILLTQGKTYTARFDIRANAAREVNASIHQNDTPWASYSGTITCQANTSWSTCHIPNFVMPQTDDVKFEIKAGGSLNGANIDIQLDNFYLAPVN